MTSWLIALLLTVDAVLVAAIWWTLRRDPAARARLNRIKDALTEPIPRKPE